MNEGVGILLERMKTHPEEFVPEYDGGTTKWGMVIGHYQTYLSKEDRETLDTAWKETVVTAMQEKFTQAVMKELLDPKPETSQYTVRGSGMPSAGVTLGAYANTSTTLTSNSLYQSARAQQASLTIGTQTLDESTIEHMKLHAQYMKAQIEAEKQKLKLEQQRKATIFGRLFNYS